MFQGGFDWDFVDQGLHRNPKFDASRRLEDYERAADAVDVKTEYTYGGDYIRLTHQTTTSTVMV